MARLSKEDAGDRIFKVLIEHSGGLTFPRICDLADLSESQARSGIAWLDDICAKDDYDIVTRSIVGGQHIYIVDAFERDVRAHYARRIRTRLKQAVRDHQRCIKTQRKFPSPENEWQEELSRRLVADLRHIETQIEAGSKAPA